MRSSLLAALAALAACHTAPHRAPAAVATGAPLPAHPIVPAACQGGDRWLDSTEHTPLVLVRDRDAPFADASGCCAAWPRRGDTWTSVDLWGAPTGQHRLTGGEGYEVTQCYEPRFDRDVHGILVRGDHAWRAPPSAAWQPDPAARNAAYELAAAVDALIPRSPSASPEAPPSPVAQRAVFFQAPRRDRAGEASHLVAIGGRALLIASLESGGGWLIRYLDADYGFSSGAGDEYRVIGVFDMDGDGCPEVIAHRTGGDLGVMWDDAVISRDAPQSLRAWSEVAQSVGGSTW